MLENFLEYDVAGPSSAFPIVFVHGVSWSRNLWVPQLQALSDEFRVIAIDLPGHGMLREQPFRLEKAMQVLIDSLKQQISKQALVVGLSLGGYVAMACANHYPQEIAGLVLSGCCIDYRGAIGFLSRLDSSLVTKLLSEDRLSRMQAKTLRRTFSDSLIEPQIASGFSWKVVPQTYRELAAYDYFAFLHSFVGPVLILNGENDRPNRKREEAVLKAAQGGQIQIIKQASHLCNLEQPEAFTQQIRTFATRLASGVQVDGI